MPLTLGTSGGSGGGFVYLRKVCFSRSFQNACVNRLQLGMMEWCQ